MHFIPNLCFREKMLEDMGLSSPDELFADIPESVRTDGVDLPPGRSEMEVDRIMKETSDENVGLRELNSFLGAGTYDHFIPAVVDHLSSRSEFLTSYTPYQAEISQGMLQSLFEFQSYMAELTGLDVSNSSLYDAATALGEAALMCKRANRRNEFIVAAPLTEKRRSVLKNYTEPQGIRIVEIPFDPETGRFRTEAIREAAGDDTCGIYVETPNFFGVLEKDIEAISDSLGDKRRRPLLVVGFNLLAAPVVKGPGETGADIAIGDVQFGIPPSFGGPTAGYIACGKRYARKLPGRLIGYTEDGDGNDAFVMTLQTREQHIRRERATSNICTNQALCAVRSAMTLASLGPKGLRDMALANLRNAHLLQEKLSGFESLDTSRFSAPFFNEFVVTFDPSVNGEKVYRRLLAKGDLFGYPLEDDFPELANSYLLNATETTAEGSADKLTEDLKDAGVR